MTDSRNDWNVEDLQGTDADLEISLKEYGTAWIEGENEILIYYGIKQTPDETGKYGYTKFDFCTVANDLDVYKEYDWADFDKIYSYVGLNKPSFDDAPLARKILDVLSYYGYESVFGESYYEGLTYAEVTEDPFTLAYAAQTEGLKAVSAGFSIECEECLLSQDICCKHKAQHIIDTEGEIVDEPSFSNRTCDTCGTHLAGDRQGGHAIDKRDGEIIHLDICTDCVLYMSNGDMPDNWSIS